MMRARAPYDERAWCRASAEVGGVVRDVRFLMPCRAKDMWDKDNQWMARTVAQSSFFTMGIGYEDGMRVKIEVRTKRGHTKEESVWELVWDNGPDKEDDNA